MVCIISRLGLAMGSCWYYGQSARQYVGLSVMGMCDGALRSQVERATQTTWLSLVPALGLPKHATVSCTTVMRVHALVSLQHSSFLETPLLVSHCQLEPDVSWGKWPLVLVPLCTSPLYKTGLPMPSLTSESQQHDLICLANETNVTDTPMLSLGRCQPKH